MASTIIQRKITIAAERKAKASLQNALVHDIEHATAKVFLNLLHTQITAVVVGSKISSHVDTIDNMRGSLFGILEIGNDVGLAGFDAQFIDTAVSILTGTNPGLELSDRDATQTDAALAKMLINTILTEVFTCADNAGNTPARSVQMKDHETQKAPLVFLLHKRRYALLSVSIAGPNGDGFGLFELVLPLGCIEKFAAEDAAITNDIPQTSWEDQMINVAENSLLTLTAVVDRIKLPLGEILDLQVGTLLELSCGSLNDLKLEAQTESGTKTLLKGHLGALNTNKAFKITQTTDQIYQPDATEAYSVA